MSLAELGFGDYEAAAKEAWPAITGAELVAFYRLAQRRHEAAVARQTRDAERYYGEPNAATGRLWRSKLETRTRNERTARTLRRVADELERTLARQTPASFVLGPELVSGGRLTLEGAAHLLGEAV